MQDQTTQDSTIVDDLRNYITTHLQLARAKITAKISTAVSMVAVVAIVVVSLFFMVFFIALGTGWWLGDLLESRAAGFFATAGIFFLLIALVVLLGKRLVINPIRNKIIRKIYE